MKPRIFEPITISLPREEIFNRLGYRAGVTSLTARQKDEYERFVDEGFSLLELKGVSVALPVVTRNAVSVTFSSGLCVTSKLLASLLEGCEQALCMGVTAGKRIVEVIAESQRDNMTKSVVFDAVASECVDACFTWVQEYANQELQRQSLQLISKRISCGYGDFSGAYQKDLYELLRLQALGVFITDSYMLVPEKSSTAVTGILKRTE